VSGYIFVLVLLVLLWFMLIRPQRRRQQEQQRLVNSVEAGKEIVTAGGLYGTITAVEDGEARVQIAPGVEVRIAKRAIAAVISEEEPEELEEDEEAGDEAETPEEARPSQDADATRRG